MYVFRFTNVRIVFTHPGTVLVLLHRFALNSQPLDGTVVRVSVLDHAQIGQINMDSAVGHSIMILKRSMGVVDWLFMKLALVQ